ncbi:MAG TPA: T9SS type A sorting domain-containing protein, partial [Bacteroidia bacterium]|nr:T9SS type A sorting domain-containing protein [Bacteroidia bacterium]
ADIIPTCVLPVKLLYFTGTNEQGKIRLDWTSEEEANSGKYIIERSDDGVDYVPIITQKAKGNSTTRTTYTAYDDNPLINKINYYKLSEYDLNGKGGLLSQTFVSNTAGFAKFNVYPNPSSGKVNINIKNFSVPSINVEIADMFGNIIWTSNIELTDGNSLQEVDLSTVGAGVYFVRTSDGAVFYNQRLIISR